jgi:hypothetical protein
MSAINDLYVQVISLEDFILDNNKNILRYNRQLNMDTLGYVRKQGNFVEFLPLKYANEYILAY